MRNAVYNEGIAGSLLKLRTLKPHICGMEHHLKPNNGGNFCPRAARNCNPLCAHTEQRILQETLMFCARIQLISSSQEFGLISLVTEAQDAIGCLDLQDATALEIYLNSGDDLPEGQASLRASLNGMVGQFENSSLVLDEDMNRDRARKYMQEQHQKLAAPITLTRQLLITLLEKAKKVDTPEEWTQARADEFLLSLACSQATIQTEPQLNS